VALIDLRGDVRRFAVLLACLALGVGVIAAVSSVGAALENAVNRDARTILGGDLEVRSNGHDVTPEQRSFIEGLGETVRVIDINVRANAGERSALLSLRAASQNYPLLGGVDFQAGGTDLSAELADTNGTPGVLLDAQALTRLGVAVGDSIEIGIEDFVVRGTLSALPDQAAQGFQLGLPAIVSDAALAGAGLDQASSLSRYSYKIITPDGDVAQAQERLLAAYPDADWDLRLPRDATANLARFFDLFSRFLTLVGLSSLLVGGVGVSNAVTAYVTERQTSIATLRSLGATSSRILVHFLSQIMLLTMAGVVLGITLGAATTLIALPILSDMLAIDLPPSVDPMSLLTAGAFGLLIGFAFALVPLRGAQKLKPASLFRASGAREHSMSWRDVLALRTSLPLALALGAIAGLAMVTTGEPRLVLWYAGGAIGAFFLLRFAAWLLQAALRALPPLNNATLRQAIRAVYRPGAPAPVVVLSLGLGLALLLMITLLDQSLRTQINGAVAEETPSFILLDVNREQLPEIEAFAAAQANIIEFDSIPMLRGTIETIGGRPADALGTLPDDISEMFKGDTSMSWAAELPEASVVTEGEWWPSDYSGPPLVSLSTELQEPLGLELGDEVTIAIAGRPITATIASFRDIDFRSNGLSFRILFSPGLIEGAPQTFMASIKASKGAEGEVETALSQSFPLITFLPVGDAIARISSILSSLANAVALVGSLAVVSGVLVLAGAMTVGRRQREADAVVMKVLGATRSDVIVAFVTEYGVLGGLAALMGAGLGTAGAWAILQFVLGIPFAPNWVTIAAVNIGAIVATIVTGVVTTWSAMSIRPARQLRQEAL
jgi:putative ABC transport system permease protein